MCYMCVCLFMCMFLYVYLCKGICMSLSMCMPMSVHVCNIICVCVYIYMKILGIEQSMYHDPVMVGRVCFQETVRKTMATTQKN